MDGDADADPRVGRPRRSPGPRALLVAALVVVVLLVAAIGVLSYRLGGLQSAAAAPTPRPTPTPTGTPSVADVFQQVGPSVVVIRTQDALGTGVVAADDGTVLTANHVIAGATRITLTFEDGSTAPAQVASTDPAHDVATLRPGRTTATLVPAVLGGDVAVGAPVVAVGNPLGLTFSVSSGVVSGLDRRGRTDAGDFSGLIQFDASVNAGSSGGPLLDADGAVVGIVVSIADPGNDDAFAGVGFAVPIGAALGGGGGDGPGPGGPQI